MRTRIPGFKSRLKSSVAAAAGLATVVGLATYAGTAGAAPQPSITQTEAKVNQLTSQFDQANQQYDQAAQQVSQARVKLALANKKVAANQAQFNKLRGAVAAIAAESYENSNMTSVAGLLSSNDPNAVLNSASLLMEISQGRNQQLSAFLVAARQLKNSQQQAQRTKDALATVEKQKLAQKQKASKSLSDEKAVYANLTSQQQATVQANSVGGSGGSTTPTTTVSSSTNGGQAANFALSKLGCPYVYGGTGPCDSGYDCSGLAQAAWAAAGVSIPRTTYDDWASLPHVSMSSLEPGDLILYDGEGHVAIYVGGGHIVDAPHSGADVEEIPMSEDWYAQNEDGAVRP
ncbi:MAG TPA: NlpC/P60 family protein [Streptosporangiaceae bacterium]|nr:NlpC/P60 family protein [Streptosporangiaceae bacterium]